MQIQNDLKWLHIDGNAWDIGLMLGKTGKEAVWKYLIKSDLWQEVTSNKHKKKLEILQKNTKVQFPLIYEEIQGLAKGLDLPFKDVFAWNCRGDILDNTNDGCTTLQLPGDTCYLAHNEDGFPLFLKKCFIADISNDNNPSFITFCYPGSIAGHTFAVNKKGLVQTVNNLRLKEVKAKLPRIVLGRAILNCNSIDEAIELLKNNTHSGGFNFSLASSQDSKIFNIEIGGGKIGILEITKPSLHANHAIYYPLNKEKQIITNSSRDRQKRFISLCANQKKLVPLDVLRDTKGEGLPIYRLDANDPDNENTMATAIFKINKNSIEYSFYESSSILPNYNGII